MMTEWYVKDVSKLTGVSVQALHYYDRIHLLKPSVRLSNGYRLYSEMDLLKLQQILALKSFGFELARIKVLMKEDINIFDHFRSQQELLIQKIKSLQEANQTLEVILSESNAGKSVSWKNIFKLIEDYQMIKEIQNKWVINVLDQSELKEYADLEQDLKKRFTPDESDHFRQKWQDIVRDVEANMNKDPGSDVGIDIGKRCLDWVNITFTKERSNLRASLWEKGFKGGHSEVPTAVVEWLDKAMDAYWRQRIYNIFSQIEDQPSQALQKQWEDLVCEITGGNKAAKDNFYEAVFADKKTSEVVKSWLRVYMG